MPIQYFLSQNSAKFFSNFSRSLPRIYSAFAIVLNKTGTTSSFISLNSLLRSFNFNSLIIPSPYYYLMKDKLHPPILKILAHL